MTYDYSLRTGKSVVELRENYDTMIQQLKDYFEGQVIANADEDLQELDLLVMLHNEITPKLFIGPQSGICLPIDIKDASSCKLKFNF